MPDSKPHTYAGQIYPQRGESRERFDPIPASEATKALCAAHRMLIARRDELVEGAPVSASERREIIQYYMEMDQDALGAVVNLSDSEWPVEAVLFIGRAIAISAKVVRASIEADMQNDHRNSTDAGQWRL